MLNFEIELLKTNNNNLKSTFRPKLFFQIRNKDNWNRDFSLGSGVLILSDSSGYFEEIVSFYHPSYTSNEKLNAFFIGLAPEYEEFPYLTNVNSSPKEVINRYGNNMVLGGRLHINFNVIKHNFHEENDVINIDEALKKKTTSLNRKGDIEGN